MAYSFIGVTKIQSSTGSSCSGSVSSSAGNMLLCGAASFEGTGVGPLVASGGGTWASDSAVHDISDNLNRFDSLLASCPSATGGSQTITVSGGTANGVTALIYEFSGNPTSSPLDSSPPAGAAGTGTSATTNSETNAQADAMFFGVMVDASGSNPATVTGNSSGWQYPAGGKETNGVTFQVIGTGYKIVAGTGAETSNWTIDSVRWDALIACYKAAAVATGPNTEFGSRLQLPNHLVGPMALRNRSRRPAPILEITTPQSPRVVVPHVNLSDATGQAFQQHVVWCEFTAQWCLAYVTNSATRLLHVLLNSSRDPLSGTWVEAIGSPITLAQAVVGGGRNFAIDYLREFAASKDIVHAIYGSNAGTAQVNHLRFQVAGTSVIVTDDFVIGAAAADPATPTTTTPNGVNMLCSPTGSEEIRDSYNNAFSQIFVNNLSTDGDAYVGSTAIGSGGWVPSTATSTCDIQGSWACHITPGRALAIYPDGAGAANPLTMTEPRFQAEGVGHNAWSSVDSSIGFTPLAAAVDVNNFGAVWVSNSDIHCILRTGSNTFSHRRYNGIGWSAGQSIPNQTSKQDAGLFMASDGSNVWLFIIDSDAANTVRYSRWNGAAWSAWYAIETSVRTRSNISGNRRIRNGVITITWTEFSDPFYDLALTSLDTTPKFAPPLDLPNHLVGPMVLRQSWKGPPPNLGIDVAPVTNAEFATRVDVPHNNVGPMTLRQGFKPITPVDNTIAATTNAEFDTRVNLPNNRVGPPALRQQWRSVPYFIPDVAPPPIPPPVTDTEFGSRVQLPNNQVGPPALRRQWRNTQYFIPDVAPVTNAEFATRVQVPSNRVGPPVLRLSWRNIPYFVPDLAPVTDQEFSTRIQLPNNQVGPPVLRQQWRNQQYFIPDVAPVTDQEFSTRVQLPNNQVGPPVLRQQWRNVPYFIPDLAPSSDQQFETRVHLPHNQVGPPVLRQQWRAPPTFIPDVAPRTDQEFSTRVILPNNQVGPPALRQSWRNVPYLIPDLAPVTDSEFATRILLPNPLVGPPALRKSWRAPPWYGIDLAARTDTEFASRIILPHNRVGPPALRRSVNRPFYPFDSTARSGNRRRRVICSGA